MKKIILMSAFASLNALSAIANPVKPTLHPQQMNDLNGTWVVRMDDVIDGTVSTDETSTCRMTLTADAESFRGTFGGCQPGIAINGNIYDNRLVSAIQYAEDGTSNFYVFSGKISPDGAIRGTYYTGNNKSGDFEWINSGIYEQMVAAQGKQTTPKGKVTTPTNGAVYIPKKGTQARPVQSKEKAQDYSVATKRPDKPADDVPEATADTQYYTVEQGDSAYRVALKFNLTVKELLRLNHKTDDKLDINDRLRVSE